MSLIDLLRSVDRVPTCTAASKVQRPSTHSHGEAGLRPKESFDFLASELKKPRSDFFNSIGRLLPDVGANIANPEERVQLMARIPRPPPWRTR
jgi:hypothetical protein